MRLPERYKRTIYVSNETYWSSGEYEQPIKLRFIVTPKTENTLIGGGLDLLIGNVELKIESNAKGLNKLTENSLIWINEEPNDDMTNSTHAVIGATLTTNGWFATIDCKSSRANVPLQ